MDIVHGTYRGGHVELDGSVDWPEGARVEIVPSGADSNGDWPKEKFGMDEADWPTTKEGIEALIARMDSREPVVYTPEELAEIEAAQKWIGDYTKAAVAKEMGLNP